MTDTADLPALLPALPEIVLAVGAMVLLMLGAFRGERRRPAIHWLAIAAAGRRRRHRRRGCPTASSSPSAAASWSTTLRASSSSWRSPARPCAILMSFDYLGREKQQKFEYPILILLVDHRHADADLGGRPDRALSRARADEPRALRGGGDRPRFRALDRGRAQVFRARRAVLRHAALRRVAGLRLHRHGLVRRHRQGRDPGRHRAHLRAGVPVRRLLLQGLGGAVPHVDARRLRGRADAGHRVLRRRAEGRRHRHVRARDHRGVPGHHDRSGSRSWCSSPSPRWCSAPSRPSASATSSG